LSLFKNVSIVRHLRVAVVAHVIFLMVYQQQNILQITLMVRSNLSNSLRRFGS